MPQDLPRDQYAALYGPTTDDRVRLGDTSLFLRIEHDYAQYGDEPLWGYGKNMRNGMMVASEAPSESELDTIIVGAIILDPVLGIFKGSIGIKAGRIVAIGNAGNPDIVDNVDLIIGPGTVAMSGAGLIATPGGVDSHVHFISPRLIPAALSGGVTTLIGAGLNHNPAENLHRALQALEDFPLNVGLQARAASHKPAALEPLIASGACGFKVHEDYGAYPPVIDAALRVADQLDVSVALHTDGLNESCEVDETVAAIAGRTVHAYHVEGAGGGHVPDVLLLVREPNVIPSSTTPTLPFAVHTAAEHFDMIMGVHGMSRAIPEDLDAARDRIRPATMAAEDLLHDMGAISIINSDSQGMGRIGETVRRTWQLADAMKQRAGDTTDDDNERILRYLAKYTINPARTHGLAAHVGSLEPGRLADIVLWHPAFFGAKPEMVIKAGAVVWSAIGEGNASIGRCEPVTYQPTWGATGNAPSRLSITFVSQLAIDHGLAEALRTDRQIVLVRGCRSIGKADLMHNAATPAIGVDPASGQVTLAGRELTCEPVRQVALNRRYFLT
ncbi:MAG: urease subunit alpha [Dehalococcoidia bacterium]